MTESGWWLKSAPNWQVFSYQSQTVIRRSTHVQTQVWSYCTLSFFYVVTNRKWKKYLFSKFHYETSLIYHNYELFYLIDLNISRKEFLNIYELHCWYREVDTRCWNIVYDITACRISSSYCIRQSWWHFCNWIRKRSKFGHRLHVFSLHTVVY